MARCREIFPGPNQEDEAYRTYHRFSPKEASKKFGFRVNVDYPKKAKTRFQSANTSEPEDEPSYPEEDDEMSSQSANTSMSEDETSQAEQEEDNKVRNFGSISTENKSSLITYSRGRSRGRKEGKNYLLVNFLRDIKLRTPRMYYDSEEKPPIVVKRNHVGYTGRVTFIGYRRKGEGQGSEAFAVSVELKEIPKDSNSDIIGFILKQQTNVPKKEAEEILKFVESKASGITTIGGDASHTKTKKEKMQEFNDAILSELYPA